LTRLFLFCRFVKEGCAFATLMANSCVSVLSQNISETIAIDLTASVGGVTLSLSRKFREVVAIEIDPLRAELCNQMTISKCKMPPHPFVYCHLHSFYPLVGNWNSLIIESSRQPLLPPLSHCPHILSCIRRRPHPYLHPLRRLCPISIMAIYT